MNNFFNKKNMLIILQENLDIDQFNNQKYINR